MAINKKLISFATQAQFAAQLSAGNIDNRSIVFIEDEKRIWTHGVYFDTSWDYITGKPDDSPQDGKTYGRKDGGWTEISSGAEVYDWMWLYDFYDPSGTCTQQQYDELLAAVQTGKIFPHAATVFAYPEQENEGYTIILGEVYIQDDYVSFYSWTVLPDLTVLTYQKNSANITKAEIEAVLTGNITSHTHSAYVPTSRKVAGKALTGDITLAKGDVGLGNVNNTSDANKPVSTAQAAAIALKMDTSKFQVVAELPASPVTGVFYFVIE